MTEDIVSPAKPMLAAVGALVLAWVAFALGRAAGTAAPMFVILAWAFAFVAFFGALASWGASRDAGWRSLSAVVAMVAALHVVAPLVVVGYRAISG